MSDLINDVISSDPERAAKVKAVTDEIGRLGEVRLLNEVSRLKAICDDYAKICQGYQKDIERLNQDLDKLRQSKHGRDN